MRNTLPLIAGVLAFAALGQETLPRPEGPFRGTIDRSREKSSPAWPDRVTAPAGAPNFVLILLDDVGFGATSAFGGPTGTPALDRLAAGGLRYNRFHVNAMCSPTRGALLSGRNNHQIGFGVITESAAGYPGYNSVWPRSSASIAEVLKLNGYSTAAFGKWHNTPVWEVSPAGPFDHWPTGLGFEYFYGILGAQTSQWEPTLYRNTTPVEAPARIAEGYNLTADLTSDAIRWVRQHDAVSPRKPFFLYLATGATHSPHHVPREWAAKFKGKFDQGWDKIREETFARQKESGFIPANAELTPRPKEIPAWDSLSADQKKLLARQMENYAGFLAQADHEVGRLLDAIRDAGHTTDTVVLYVAGDNGASAEGGFDGRDAVGSDGKPLSVEERLKLYDRLGSEDYSNMYATPWGWALNTPFQWAKRVASHLGGTRDPLIVSWPGHIKDAGTVRSQFHHITDIAPTIFELAGVRPPSAVNGVDQTPLEGKSLAYSFDHAEAPSPHRVQYFEMLGSRGIYQDGWWAGSRNQLPWNAGNVFAQEIPSPEDKPWELYHLETDYSQAHDLAAQNPGKLEELKKLFDSEARRNQVYPLVPRRLPQPSPASDARTFVYRIGVQRIPAASAPRLAGRSHRITADLQIPEGGAQGVIIAQGGRYGGFSLYLKDGHVIFEVNRSGHAAGSLVSTQAVEAGRARIVLQFTPDPATEQPGQPVPGSVSLSINGAIAGKTRIPGLAVSGESLDVGSDLGSPVSSRYVTPFAFTGTIEAVTVDLP